MRQSCYSTLSVAVCLVMIGPQIAATSGQQTGAMPARKAADRLEVARRRIRAVEAQLQVMEANDRLVVHRFQAGKGFVVSLEMVQEAPPFPVVTPVREEEDEDGDVAPAPLAPVRSRFIIREGSFDRAIFGTQADTQIQRRRFDHILDEKIAEIAKNNSLTDSQQQRLKLAGRGDIKHFHDQVAVARRKFDLLRTDLPACRTFVAEQARLHTDFMEGPFHENSLYFKTLRKLLNEGRVAPHEPE